MENGDRKRWKSLVRSSTDLEIAKAVPDTPQTRAPAYRLAFDDHEFMTSEELRPVRLQLELLKPEMRLEAAGIESTVVMFGGARIPEPGGEAWAAKNEIQKKNLEANSWVYEEARKFAQIASRYSATTDYSEMVVVTGGGPGVTYSLGACSCGNTIFKPIDGAPTSRAPRLPASITPGPPPVTTTISL